MRIPDYNDLHAAHEREQERRLSKYPKCDCCKQPITDEHFFKIDGRKICEACMMDDYRENTDDYMED